jgi:fluoride ion exporter CrcB/FEX
VSLHVTAGIVLLACAVAIALAPSLPGWWRPLAITGAALGLVAFSVFWDGQTRLLFEEGVIGAVVSLVLLIGAIALASGRL